MSFGKTKKKCIKEWLWPRYFVVVVVLVLLYYFFL